MPALYVQQCEKQDFKILVIGVHWCIKINSLNVKYTKIEEKRVEEIKNQDFCK